MNLSKNQRLTVQAFQDAGAWFPRLAAFLNNFIDNVALIFNKQITVTDNMDGQISIVRLDGQFPVKFQWTRSQPPVVLLVGGIRRTSGEALNLAAAFSIDWDYQEGSVRINGTPGLTSSSSTQYYLTVMGLTG